MQVGDDKEKLKRFNEVREASDMLTKRRADYDKSIENQEQVSFSPLSSLLSLLHTLLYRGWSRWSAAPRSTLAHSLSSYFIRGDACKA